MIEKTLKRKEYNTPLLHCVNLTKYYQYKNFSLQILNCITLSIKYNEIIAITGESGSGKSTLLHLIGGLDKPTKGEIFFKGIELNKLSDKDCSLIRNKHMGFIYQFHHLLPDFNVIENVAMPLLISNIHYKIAMHRSYNMLKSVGLDHRVNHYPHELSGGESQRAAIARSVINNPSLILADEPTGNLDKKNAENIFNLLKTLNINYGTTFIIATHDVNLVKKCHKILTISNGSIIK